MVTTDLRALIEREAVIEVEAEQDDMPVRGNALASGDDAVDRECEDGIIERLNDGDVWAWAAVAVRATWRELRAEEYLGGCSYADEADFRANSVYFDDMRERAIDQLVEQAEAIRAD